MSRADTPAAHQPAGAALRARGRRDPAAHDAARRRAAEALPHRRAQSRDPGALPHAPAPTSSTSGRVEPARPRGADPPHLRPLRVRVRVGRARGRLRAPARAVATSSCARPCTGGADDPSGRTASACSCGSRTSCTTPATVSESLWAKLAAHWDAAQLVELVATAGFYHLVSFTANAAGVRARAVRRAVSRPTAVRQPERIALRHATRCCSACSMLLAVAAGGQHGRHGPRDQGRRTPTSGASSTCRAATSRCARTGPRDAPAVVLLHGFACSIALVGRVAPALARDHRVIRIRPARARRLGEAEATAMGWRARRGCVAAALDRLGVRRADVVGHSMGGSVATALAEQRPAAGRVARDHRHRPRRAATRELPFTARLGLRAGARPGDQPRRAGRDGPRRARVGVRATGSTSRTGSSRTSAT